MFSIYMDKENSGSGLGVMAAPQSAAPRTAPVGKTFQQSSQNDLVQKFKGLRMGDVNTLGHTPRPTTKSRDSVFKKPGDFVKPPKPLQMMKAPKSTNVPPQLAQSQKQEVKLSKTTSAVPQPTRHYDEIEFMPVYNEKDDFEDLWPAAERPGTYAKAFRAWKPEALLPGGPSACEMLPPPSPPSPVYSRVRDYTLEDGDLDSPMHIPSLEELGLSLPPLDEVFLSDEELFSQD